MKKKILVLSGGRGDERVVSLKSGHLVARALDRKRFKVVEAELSPRLEFIFLPERKRNSFLDGLKALKSRHIDCVFPALHGEFGEDGHLQAILESMNIPFVGSGSLASQIAMDKRISDALFRQAGFHLPRTLVLETVEDLKQSEKFFKQTKRFVLKPVCGGSSVGVIIGELAEIKKHSLKNLKQHKPMLLQEFMAGRELTCGVVERSSTKIMVLTPTEIRPKSGKFFDYTAKYASGGSSFVTPPDIPRFQLKEIQDLALRAHRLLGCRGLSRSDFILSRRKMFILETNTLPGMTETSLLPQGAAACGISFQNLLTLLIERALQ
ncbi:MAG: D-alanine--D-alanine ligase [Patescibacteria group bacterium]